MLLDRLDMITINDFNISVEWSHVKSLVKLVMGLSQEIYTKKGIHSFKSCGRGCG